LPTFFVRPQPVRQRFVALIIVVNIEAASAHIVDAGLKVRASQKPCGRNAFGFDLIALSNDDNA
jgi:hypothetical protein